MGLANRKESRANLGLPIANFDLGPDNNTGRRVCWLLGSEWIAMPGSRNPGAGGGPRLPPGEARDSPIRPVVSMGAAVVPEGRLEGTPTSCALVASTCCGRPAVGDTFPWCCVGMPGRSPPQPPSRP